MLIITGELDENLFPAARNPAIRLTVRDATGIDPVSLIAFDKVVRLLMLCYKLRRCWHDS
ncbi:hypothetical protein KCP74_08005 [Salmonella enterica subsp. enterica]|nr:hypothetical protein KCP74_08005 [Salmonella enterica subsp. enterica]